jgi:hypothetical protein
MLDKESSTRRAEPAPRPAQPHFQQDKTPPARSRYLQIVAKLEASSKQKLTRVAFRVSRLMEFCTARCKVKPGTRSTTGRWSCSRDLTDNALDEVERGRSRPCKGGAGVRLDLHGFVGLVTAGGHKRSTRSIQRHPAQRPPAALPHHTRLGPAPTRHEMRDRHDRRTGARREHLRHPSLLCEFVRGPQ